MEGDTILGWPPGCAPIEILYWQRRCAPLLRRTNKVRTTIESVAKITAAQSSSTSSSSESVYHSLAILSINICVSTTSNSQTLISAYTLCTTDITAHRRSSHDQQYIILYGGEGSWWWLPTGLPPLDFHIQYSRAVIIRANTKHT